MGTSSFVESNVVRDVIGRGIGINGLSALIR
jgi:hypothetical protein